MLLRLLVSRVDRNSGPSKSGVARKVAYSRVFSCSAFKLKFKRPKASVYNLNWFYAKWSTSYQRAKHLMLIKGATCFDVLCLLVIYFAYKRVACNCALTVYAIELNSIDICATESNKVNICAKRLNAVEYALLACNRYTPVSCCVKRKLILLRKCPLRWTQQNFLC